ncbi:MAG: sulfatase-like hydrolase/transferase [Clostridia bacterium]|nr:sulfatase-like hydrolase/transferase [Clostridia bacterium]
MSKAVLGKKLCSLLKNLRAAFFPLMFCYLELLLHIYAYSTFDKNIVWIILFSIGLGLIPALLTEVFPNKLNHVLTYVFIAAVTLVFEIQTVYFAIFRGFAPVSSVKLGTQAVTNFTGGLWEGIRNSLVWILLILVPLLLYIIYDILMRPSYKRPRPVCLIAICLAVVFTLGGSVGTLAIFFSGEPSLYHTFSSSSTATDTAVKSFGLNITMLQEMRFMLFPDSGGNSYGDLLVQQLDSTHQADLSVDLVELYEKAGDGTALQNLTAAVSHMPVSKKNEYTGICEGYNIVAICAEAFSPEFIDPELTPALYKLSTNGFVFNNFYATFPNTTTNGEYAFCMGLFPDMSREKVDSSFGESADNYLPYCYGNLFREMGGVARAYHNYVAEFYYRNFTHTNMGYDFKAANSGLDISVTWPSSDYEMMLESCPEYVSSDVPFAAYYMTFSGHYQYTLDNAMSAKNWDIVKDLPYSDIVKAYIACNLELEYAVASLMEQLEAAGKADRTMIVLSTDHYPYGLDVDEGAYAELSGREINDDFDRLKNAFICYVPGIERVDVDAYCSTVDILPTVLNLLGITYDSRLLAGCDVLDPESEHLAILHDKSFIADGVKYNASSIEFTYDENTDESRERGKRLYDLVKLKFDVSAEILYNDYYSYVFDRSTDSEAIVDITGKYEDIGIMKQAPAYYVLKHDLMDPESETQFGFTAPYSYAEMIDSAYRIEGSPAVNIPEGWTSRFSADAEYENALYWALDQGIIADDGITPYDLSEAISIGGCAVIVQQLANLRGADTSVDAASADEIALSFPSLDRKVLEALLYCKNVNLIIGDGSAGAPFKSADAVFLRSSAVNLIYKFCTYNLG